MGAGAQSDEAVAETAVVCVNGCGRVFAACALNIGPLEGCVSTVCFVRCRLALVCACDLASGTCGLVDVVGCGGKLR